MKPANLKGSRVLVLGIAYKKNVDDMRESPSVELMELFKAKGADVHYSDPFFPDFPPMRKHAFQLSSVSLSAGSVASFDAVVLATDHDAFDYPLIEAHSQLLIDARGRFAPANTSCAPDSIMQLLTVVGARPQFIKAALSRAIAKPRGGGRPIEEDPAQVTFRCGDVRSVLFGAGHS